MRHRDQRHALATVQAIARRGACDGRGRGTRGRGRLARALYAGVHVGLVVVADVEHVIVAFEYARQAAHADIGSAAVAALGDYAHVFSASGAQRGRDSRANRRRVTEQRVDPRQAPGRLRVGRGENFQAAGRVGGDELIVGGTQRGVDHVARAQRLAAALAGTMPRVERVRAFDARLYRALGLVQQPVANGEGAGLVKLYSLFGFWKLCHREPLAAASAPAMSRKILSALEPGRWMSRKRSSSRCTTSTFRS